MLIVFEAKYPRPIRSRAYASPVPLPRPSQGSLPARAGLPLAGQVSHLRDDKRNFMETSQLLQSQSTSRAWSHSTSYPLTLSTTTASAQVCASLTLTTQAQVDAASCSSLTGRLWINGPDITDLSPLSSVTSVGGYLHILNNSALTNLDGLGGITSVGGDLLVQGNDVLDNFCGLFPLLDASGLVGVYNVNNNAANPTEAEILAGGACLVSPVPSPNPVPSLNPLGLTALLLTIGLVGLAAQRKRQKRS